MKKVYIIVGVYSGNSVYHILSNYSIKSTLEKAQEELKNIKEEFLKNTDKEDIIDITEDNTSIKFIYGNDEEEFYNIETRIIDYE